MKIGYGPIIAIIIGVCITTALPIFAAITLSRQQEIESQQDFALKVARSALIRTEMTGDQLAASASTINALTPEQACSPEGIAQMRELDLGSTLLQAVGRMEGNRMRCSSIGGDEAFDLGPPDFISSTGAAHRRDVILIDPDKHYLAVQSGDAVGIVHKDLPLSFVEESPGMAVAVFSWSHRKPLISRGEIPPEIFERAVAGDTVFRLGDRQVAIVRSQRYDTGGVALLPPGGAASYAGKTAMVLIPIGVLLGVVLSVLLVHVVRNRASLPMMIRSALRRNRFHLLYQPVIDLEDGRIVGVEALVRWDRGKGLDIPPERFIPAAEEAELIPLITARVLELLAQDARHFHHAAADLHFAVNFSAQDFHREGIVEEVERLVKGSGIAPEKLVIEATERGLVETDLARNAIERLRATGIRIAIDDFGTGYSSLAYLAQLDVDFLKIDKLFVRALDAESATSQVAARIMDVARDFGLIVIAEGIETPRQEQLLRQMGVKFAQGFLYGCPMPLRELLGRLHAQRTAPQDTGIRDAA